MSMSTAPGRHRAPRSTARTRALRAGATLAVSAGLATVAVLPASANSAGLEEASTTHTHQLGTQQTVTTPTSGGQSAAHTHALDQRSQEASASRSAARETVASSSSGSAILDYAEQYTGIMYLWGGSTPDGFDCSGYTQFVFAQAGINIPRTTEAQRQASTPVSTPQPGDLVFWGAPAYHVAIYAGDGMIYDSGRAGLPSQKRAMFSGVTSFGRIG